MAKKQLKSGLTYGDFNIAMDVVFNDTIDAYSKSHSGNLEKLAGGLGFNKTCNDILGVLTAYKISDKKLNIDITVTVENCAFNRRSGYGVVGLNVFTSYQGKNVVSKTDTVYQKIFDSDASDTKTTPVEFLDEMLWCMRHAASKSYSHVLEELGIKDDGYYRD